MHNLIALIQNPKRAEDIAVEAALESGEISVYLDLKHLGEYKRQLSHWLSKYYSLSQYSDVPHLSFRHVGHMFYSMVPFVYSKDVEGEHRFINNSLTVEFVLYNYFHGEVGYEQQILPFEEMLVLYPANEKREEVLKKIRALM